MAVADGRQSRQGAPDAGAAAEPASDQPRRSRRAQFRADEPSGPGERAPETVPTQA
jgi:hypothetical protein